MDLDKARPPRRGSERLGVVMDDIAVRVGVSPRAVVGLLLVLVLVVTVLGMRVAQTRERSIPEPLPPVATLSQASAAPAASSASSAAQPLAPGTATSSPVASSAVQVHVVGQVRRPGVVRLSAGARVQQAITAAGGALPGAALSQVNLARVVADGEQVVVPRPGDAPPTAPLGAAGGSAGGPTAGGTPGALVDLNTADLAALDTLPGVGPVLAQRIVDWRTTNGRFSSVEELGEVSGIGDAVLGQLRALVRV